MTKERATALAKQLREAARQGDPHARAAAELVQLTIDDLKDRLVEASGEETLRLQGAARHLRKIYNELTRTPPSLSKE